MQRCVDDRCSDEWLTVRWCRSSGSEPDRARERPSPWLPTRGTVLLEGGEDLAQHGSIGKGSRAWATRAGDFKQPFDHSICGAVDIGLRSGFITRNGWSGQMTNKPGAMCADEEIF